jgi:hypothetical protein
LPTLRSLTESLVAVSLLIALVSNYLIINKLWKRRAVRDVAESISVSAALLGLSTALPFLVLFLFVDQSPAGAAKTLIGIVTGLVFVTVGSGMWVPELRDRRFRSLFVGALKLERKESADLIKLLVQPKGADRILVVLQQLAAVDGHIDEGELELIRGFADRWRLPAPTGTVDGEADLLVLRNSVENYLGVSPPREQAAQLLDLLHLLSQADAHVSWQETLALEEVGGMIRHYLARGAGAPPAYEVVIVPQSEAQVDAVHSLLPDAKEKMVRGGRVFSVGIYFSPQFAERICQTYIALGLFTTLLEEVAEGAAEAGASGAPPPAPTAAARSGGPSRPAAAQAASDPAAGSESASGGHPGAGAE